MVERCSFFTFRIDKSVDVDTQSRAMLPYGLQRRGIDRDTVFLALP